MIGAHVCSHCSLGKGLRAGWTVEGCRSGISARLNIRGCRPEALYSSAGVTFCQAHVLGITTGMYLAGILRDGYETKKQRRPSDELYWHICCLPLSPRRRRPCTKTRLIQYRTSLATSGPNSSKQVCIIPSHNADLSKGMSATRRRSN